MKKIVTATVAIAFVLLAGCMSATPAAPTSNAPGTRNFKFGKGDGLTMSSAVEIRTRSETDGGIMIQEWIKQRYPGYVVHQQELIEQRDKAFNMITILGPSNTATNIYFDISTYYRRIGNSQFPKPLS
ncbi:MAG: hypothetical protein ABWY34_06995 [Pseudoxanthomonas sp.]